MCGRYYIDIDAGELQDIVNAAKTGTIPEDMTLKTDGEIFPTNVVPVMTAPGVVKPMQWGFASFDSKSRPIINARSETVFDRKMFSGPMQKGRCLIPCSGYFEWQTEGRVKTKHFFHLPGKGTMYLAGCWRQEKGKPLPTFVILTRDAAGHLADIHPRMPVIIPRDLADVWLTDGTQIAEVLRQAVTALAFEPVGGDDGQISLF